MDAYKKSYDNMKKAKVDTELMQSIAKFDFSEKPEMRRDFTVKVTFPFAGKPFLRDEVLVAVSEHIDKEDIVAAGPLEDN